jgi:hypothetical protein
VLPLTGTGTVISSRVFSWGMCVGNAPIVSFRFNIMIEKAKVVAECTKVVFTKVKKKR